MFVNNSIMKKTILASASPRRKELIASLPIQIVSIIPAQNELPYQKRLSPEQNVAAISAAKAENVSDPWGIQTPPLPSAGPGLSPEP